MCRVQKLVSMGIWFPERSYLLRTFHNYVLLRIASGRYFKYGRFDIFLFVVFQVYIIQLYAAIDICILSSLYYPAVCSHRDLILYTITVGKITAVQAPCYIYRRQNYKYNSNFIPKTFANLIEPKMWPLCMCSGPTADGLTSPTKMKTFWVIKYLNIYSTNK